MVFVVAVTGGIASGKTTVSKLFADLGVPMIDTDVVARELAKPGTRQFDAIVDTFGAKIVTKDGQLDRVRLRRIVFGDTSKRRTLESILHPAIYAEVKRQLAELDTAYCLVVVPLLAETGVPKWADRVLVVDADEGIQLERLTHRDQVSLDQARSALEAQASHEARLSIADDIISNDGSIDDLYDTVQMLHRRYIVLSADSAQDTS